jgi:hypothetical protein
VVLVPPVAEGPPIAVPAPPVAEGLPQAVKYLQKQRDHHKLRDYHPGSPVPSKAEGPPQAVPVPSVTAQTSHCFNVKKFAKKDSHL